MEQQNARWLILGGITFLFLVAGLAILSKGREVETPMPSRRVPDNSTKSPIKIRSFVYLPRSTPQQTALATLKANGMPTCEGKWYYIGPFDNVGGKGFATVYPPERRVDLKASYTGKNGATIRWQEFKPFVPGHVVNLAVFKKNNDACVYLYHALEATKPLMLPLSLGSDDTLSVWLNSKSILSKNVARAAAPDQDRATLALKAGKNDLLLKVCNGGGGWQVYVCPQLPPEFDSLINPKIPPVLLVRCGKGKGAKQNERIDRGFGCELVRGKLFDGWNTNPSYCWYDSQRLVFKLDLPRGTAGTLRLHFVDGDRRARKQALIVAGKKVGDIQNFADGGKVVFVRISKQDAKKGSVEVQLDNLNTAINAVVSEIAYYADTR